MTNRLKSNSNVADSIKSEIKVQGASIGQVNMGGGEKTNLIVMDKLNSAIKHINAVNNAYQELLLKDATAISTVKETYEDLDDKLSHCIGIE